MLLYLLSTHQLEPLSWERYDDILRGKGTNNLKSEHDKYFIQTDLIIFTLWYETNPCKSPSICYI